MVTAQELAVKIKSTGVSETRDDVEAIGESMEETADQSGDAAEELVGFSEDLAGAASAAVAGIALITGGLLSQVPILSEFAAGLGAIVSAIGLQIDQLLRDLGAGGLTEILFTVANGILSLEGAAGDLAGVLGVILTAATGAAAGLAAWAIKAKGVAGAASAAAGALKTVATGLAGIVAGVSATTAALAVGVAAIVAFAAAYLTNFRGVRDTTDRIVGNIIDTVVGGVRAFATAAISRLSSFASRVRGVLTGVSQRFVNWAAGLASQARNWGQTVIERFINGIESMLGALKDVLDDLPFIGRILDLFDRLSDAIAELDLGGEIRANLNTGAGGGGGGGGGGTGRSGSAPARNAFGGGSGATLDGRKLTESTGRYRSDPGRRRGL